MARLDCNVTRYTRRQGMDSQRLWRVRKRYDHIDAEIRRRGPQWELTISRNDRRLFSWRFADRDGATSEARTRLRDLQRSGWHTHW
jgi:hypothetical protein